MRSLLNQMLLFAANTNLDYIAHSHMQIKNSQMYLLELSQNQMPWGSTLVNPTTAGTIVMQQ